MCLRCIGYGTGPASLAIPAQCRMALSVAFDLQSLLHMYKSSFWSLSGKCACMNRVKRTPPQSRKAGRQCTLQFFPTLIFACVQTGMQKSWAGTQGAGVGGKGAVKWGKQDGNPTESTAQQHGIWTVQTSSESHRPRPPPFRIASDRWQQISGEENPQRLWPICVGGKIKSCGLHRREMEGRRWLLRHPWCV